MISLLLSQSRGLECERIVDLGERSDFDNLTLKASESACLRFTHTTGIFVMNNIGHANAFISSSAASSLPPISSYTYDATMFDSTSIGAHPRAVKFGSKFGIISVHTSYDTEIFYTYFYANENCNNISVTTNYGVIYSYPNSSTGAFYQNTNYCFLAAAYGPRVVTVNRLNSTEAAGDSMHFSNINSTGNVNFGESQFFGPIQFVFSPNSTESSPFFNISVSSYFAPHYAIIEGAFDSANSPSYVYYYNSAKEYTPNTSGNIDYDELIYDLKIIAIVLGSFGCAALITFGIVKFMKKKKDADAGIASSTFLLQSDMDAGSRAKASA